MAERIKRANFLNCFCLNWLHTNDSVCHYQIILLTIWYKRTAADQVAQSEGPKSEKSLQR